MGGFLRPEGEAGAGDLRHSIPQLGHIAEDDPWMEVAFYVRLFEWHDLGAEQVAEGEGHAEVLPQTCAMLGSTLLAVQKKKRRKRHTLLD